MLDENLLLCKKKHVVMFVLKYIEVGGWPPDVLDIQYTYTDPSTKQTVTKLVNSTGENVFPCVIGDTVTFSNLTRGYPEFDPSYGPGNSGSGWGTWLYNGVDVSPTVFNYFASSLSVTVSGSSPYIEYYFTYGIP